LLFVLASGEISSDRSAAGSGLAPAADGRMMAPGLSFGGNTR
jgi:hypothetical protein